MENKVGDNLPAPKKIDDLVKQTASHLEELQTFCITLQKDERATTVKPPNGTEQLVPTVHDLATRHEITVKNVPLNGMMNDLRLAQAMPRFQALFALGAQLVADTMLQAKSEYYTAFLAYYDALVAAADHDPLLAAELKPIKDAMRKQHRSSHPTPNNGAPPPDATAKDTAVKNG